MPQNNCPYCTDWYDEHDHRELTTEQARSIVIIGGGFSGTALAINLMRHRSTLPLHITLIERAPRFGRGVAYGSDCSLHLLNVPAAKMSALPDQPQHFLHWLQRHDPEATPTTFAPRMAYGQYLEDLLNWADTMNPSQITFTKMHDEALAITPLAHNCRAAIRLKSGTTVLADRVALALGNFPPTDPPISDPTFYSSKRYVRNPWAADVFAELSPDDSVLFIGTGLTMIDKVLELYAGGHRGDMIALSRHGLLPHAHRSTPSSAPGQVSCPISATPPVVRLLYRDVLQAIDRIAIQGGDWRQVIDSLRPTAQQTWQALPSDEQSRFLRHLRPYWEVHRHRVAAAVGAQVDALLDAGQLQASAGRIQGYREDRTGVDVIVRPRGSAQTMTIRVARVVNCTGPEFHLDRVDSVLLANLRQQGLIRAGHVGLGLDVDNTGAVLSAAGYRSPTLFTFGLLQRGCLWETTAVPELSIQATTMAATLIHSTAVGQSLSDATLVC